VRSVIQLRGPVSPGESLGTPRLAGPVQQRRFLGLRAEASDPARAGTGADSAANETTGRGGGIWGPRGHPIRSSRRDRASGTDRVLCKWIGLSNRNFSDIARRIVASSVTNNFDQVPLFF
jgi:hypothetical protein